MELADEDSVMLPGQLDADDESPYLRRQKAAALRRGRFPRRFKWILFGLAVVLPVGFAGYLLTTFALDSSYFDLRSADDVVITGNQFASREEILNALALPLHGDANSGVNIFRLALEPRKKQVESIPWVRSASLTRVYPNRLAVFVVERTPIAFANVGGRVCLVDADGVLLEKPESAPFDFPVLTGLDTARRLEDRRGRLAEYQEFVQDINDEASRSGWQISEVDLADPEDLKALLVLGRETLQVHFGHKDYLERFRSFLALLPEVRKTNARLDSVDLRYHNQIVVNPQTVDSQGR